MPTIPAEYYTLPLPQLALTLASRHDPNAAYILQQVEGYQRMQHKVPSWTQTEGVEFPPRLALEQCSGEEAARYKAEAVQRSAVFEGVDGNSTHLIDLTGGMGVDFSFLAPLFAQATYVERQAELCRLAAHNLPLLDLPRAQVVNAEAEAYLETLPPDAATMLFIDPARRDTQGRKTVFLSDCEPNLVALAPRLLEKAPYVLAKLSTMLDVTQALRDLRCVEQVHIFATEGECKDLLLLLSRRLLQLSQTTDEAAPPSPRLFIREGEHTLSLSPADEATACPTYATALGAYLYEPGPALMKAGVFKWTAQHYGLQKLHPNSHLYTSPSSEPLAEPFAGRTFRVLQVLGFGKQDVKALRQLAPRANLTVRNFPATVDVLRKKLKIKEGGHLHLFATTLGPSPRNQQHVLVVCERI